MDGRLKDGTEPLTPEALLARLDALGIPHRTLTHPPVFTVDQARELVTKYFGDIEAGPPVVQPKANGQAVIRVLYRDDDGTPSQIP